MGLGAQETDDTCQRAAESKIYIFLSTQMKLDGT